MPKQLRSPEHLHLNRAINVASKMIDCLLHGIACQ